MTRESGHRAGLDYTSIELAGGLRFANLVANMVSMEASPFGWCQIAFFNGCFMRPQIDVKTWEECETEVKKIRAETAGAPIPILFRGQSDANWALLSSLERRCPNEQISLEKYYHLITQIKHEIGAFTNTVWKTPTFSTLREWSRTYDGMRTLKSYDYLAYLRHHNFPSPLLDWTRSLYIAAYFAFAHAKGKRVSLYVYADRIRNFKTSSSNTPTIFIHGPLVRTHKRHFRQQSTYTACMQFLNAEWQFAAHQKVFESEVTGQDVLWKVTIPSTERTKVLQLLDEYNLNAFSLFDNEEGLMETLAVRSFDLGRK